MAHDLKYGCFCTVGGRNYQEDRLVSLKDCNGSNRHYFAVFDGHGGSIVSDFLSKNFHGALFQHSLIKNQPINALQEVWSLFDEQCYKTCQVEEKKDQSKSFPQDGSTATICYINGDDIYITNCGDSAAYSVSANSTTLTILTEDHGTLNHEEVTRCERAGGKLSTESYTVSRGFPFCCIGRKIPGKPRMYPGGLLVTRAFGDFHAKVEYLGGKRGVVVHDHGKIKYLNAAKTEDLSKRVKYLILASDGVWDGLTAEEVLDILNGHIPQSATASPAKPNAVASNAVIPMPQPTAPPAESTPQADGVSGVIAEVEASVTAGHINTNVSCLDAHLTEVAKQICMSAVASPKWKDYGSSPDNTSCIVIELTFT